MKLYIWEGNGISSAYHDDGTLVVLAHSPDDARRVVREARDSQTERRRDWDARRDALATQTGYSSGGTIRLGFWHEVKEAADLWEELANEVTVWDGSDEALDRDPDRVVEIDHPTWVAFNGGGYD